MGAKRHNGRKGTAKRGLPAIIAALVAGIAIAFVAITLPALMPGNPGRANTLSLEELNVPAYSGKPSVEINGNAPFFTEDDLKRSSFEEYAALDALGRCGTAFALAGKETMPAAERQSIGMIKPSGWQTSRYDFVDGGYLFNRCHLIAFALTGENDNERNLITGTRSMNTQGMLPFEERTAAYIDATGNHVLYRATPVFEGSNLVASGVLLEAESVEDRGAGLMFCTWCYNVEPGVAIDYATGENHASAEPETPSSGNAEPSASSNAGASTESRSSSNASVTTESRSSSNAGATAEPSASGNASATAEASSSASRQAAAHYVLNTKTLRFHRPDCPSVADMKEKNKAETDATRDELIAQGYTPCGSCKP